MNHTPNGSYATVCEGKKYAEMIRQQGGEAAARQWAALERELAPLGQGAALFPAAVLRFDPGQRLQHLLHLRVFQAATSIL